MIANYEERNGTERNADRGVGFDYKCVVAIDGENIMQKNMGPLDRRIRAAVGSALLLAALFIPAIAENAMIFWLVIVVVAANLGSSMAGLCPVYLVARVNSLPAPDNSPE
jgi:hypothetical protein